MYFALFAWFARAALSAGIAKIATGKACNECKTLGQLGQTAFFLILVARNNKNPSGIDGKTSDCLSRICLYYRYLELLFR